jgi:hypothetical protein
MKKIFIMLSFVGLLFAADKSIAQSMSSPHDTVSFSTSGYYEAHNDLTNLLTSPLTVQWRVVATNFPNDWLANTGICDNCTCISGTGLWPATSPYECLYAVSTTPGTFKMQIDLATASGVTTNGTYYMRVRLNNKFGLSSDELFQTYIVTRSTTSVSVVKMAGDVAIYPNPATTSLNVLFDQSSDVRNIAVYNIIGKQVGVYRVSNQSSASLNIENLPSGIYFTRLLNVNGDVVATRKFTKQ